jgi:ATP-dependent RNA helicase RhlE
MSKFEDFGLAEPILRAVRAEGYQTPTPIQQQAIAPLMSGRDLMGCAQTGTGKTAAFALPTLHRLGQENIRVNGRGRKIRALILAPTRELASQIGASFGTYGKHMNLRYALVYGGVSQHPQVRALNGGVDILVATPGRLLDLMNQGFIDLAHVEILILDEGDQMLDMGFIDDLRRIVSKVPAKRQTLLFSATMPEEIRRVAAHWLRDPLTVQVAAVSAPAEKVSHSVYFVEQRHKPHLLTHFLESTATTRALVFTRTKSGADKVVRMLLKSGIRAEAIHGNKSQSARERALRSFKSSQPPILVATDIAARGLDIDEISHVVNFDLPMVAETYVHRIGRTARAGASGVAVSFCDASERSQLRAIERLMRKNIAVASDQPKYPPREPSAAPTAVRSNGNGHANGGGSRRPQGKPPGGQRQNGPRVNGQGQNGQRTRAQRATVQAASEQGQGAPGRSPQGQTAGAQKSQGQTVTGNRRFAGFAAHKATSSKPSQRRRRYRASV